MDPKQITSLAKLLRDSGDRILSSEFKLTLSGSLLRALNDSFTLIADQSELFSPSTFQVVKPNNSKSDVFRDLQLIHDFVQKTLILCIMSFPGDDYFEGIIDITKFRCLRTLEIQKVNIKQIIGIQPLRAQIQNLICIRSLQKIDDIITYCGGDKSNGFVWNELKTADFSYNNLKHIDTSLEFAQYLQTLNLSHNQLISVEAIKWLPNLKILNLSFNRLTKIPNFHIESIRRLQTLLLNNNFIEDLSSLQRLDALTDLDLSNNCLLDHAHLLPLNTLIALKYLNLSGNPLSCHPNHRLATAHYLHKNTASVKFVLDSLALTKVEKCMVGNYQKYHYSALSPSCPPSSSTSISGTVNPTMSQNRRSQAQTPSSSFGSLQSFKFNAQESENELTTDATSMTSSMLAAEKQKKSRRRMVEIEQQSSTSSGILSKSTKNVIAASTDHLETKKQIEDLRNKFGAGWLHSDNSHMVKSVIGLDEITDELTENDDDNNSNKKRIPHHQLTSKQLIDDLLNQITNNDPKIDYGYSSDGGFIDKDNVKMLSSTPKVSKDISDESGVEKTDIEIVDEDANETLYKTISDEQNATLYNSLGTTEDNSNILDDIYATKNDEPEISDVDESDKVYIVTDKEKNEFFLMVSNDFIKEKDTLTQRTKTKWSLKILQSCDRIKSNTLRINFDTVKKDKKERIYTIEEGLCQELEKYLRDILSERHLSEMNQTIYRCVNCSCQFSRENTYKKTLNVFCPECKSGYVVEILETSSKISNLTEYGKEVKILDETVTTSSSNFVQVTEVQATTTPTTAATTTELGINVQGNNQSSGENNYIEKTSSNGSLDSAGSLNDRSSSCSKISNSHSSFDSNQSVAGSSTNERDIDFSKSYESDVEILSNPSQSSIEVLDSADHSAGLHPSRKTSEERKMLYVPSLEAIDDKSIGGTNLLWNYDNLQQQTRNTDVEETIVEITKSTDELETSKNEDIKKIDLVGKKNLFGNVNLTESSSSGSVTDSICTTYEHNDKGLDEQKNRTETKATNNENNTTNTNILPNKEKDGKKDESLISSMLGGIFQSTNLLMSRTQKSTTTNSDANLSSNSSEKCEKFKFNYENFSDIDHRLKLYFYVKKFDDSNEHFKWLVKGKILNENNGELFEGIIVLSTTKLYIMEINGMENDDIGKWLRQQLSVKINRLEKIQLLSWHIGLAFHIHNCGTYLLILQDILRTDSLLLFFANNPLPENCVIDYQISENVAKKLSNCCNSEQLKMFSVLNKCEIIQLNTNCEDKIIYSPTSLFTTDSHLYLTSSNLLWLSNNSNYDIELNLTQLMSNLVEVDVTTSKIFSINFLDETNDKSELWKCEFETSENAESCLNAIGQSWEKLFGVPLGCN